MNLSCCLIDEDGESKGQSVCFYCRHALLRKEIDGVAATHMKWASCYDFITALEISLVEDSEGNAA